MAEGTLVADPPVTIADEPQPSSETEEQRAPGVVETEGVPAGDETDDANDPLAGLTDEQIAANPRLKKLLAAKDFQHQQSLKDTRESIEREAKDAAAKAEWDQRRAWMTSQQTDGARAMLQRELGRISSLVEDGKHIDERGVNHLNEWVGQLTQSMVSAMTGAAFASEYGQMHDVALATLAARNEGWKPSAEDATKFARAARSNDPLAMFTGLIDVTEAALISRLEPATRKKVEAELAEAAAAEKAAGESQAATEARKQNKPTSVSGTPGGGPPANWRDLSPLSKGYREGYRAEHGVNPPGI